MSKTRFVRSFARTRKLVLDHFASIVGGADHACVTRVAKILDYNVTGGKHMRATALINAFRAMKPGNTDEELQRVYSLGWGLEIMQAYLLMADDIMDRSVTRRGRPCWYKIPEIGLSAVNDVLLLSSVVDFVIAKEYKSHYACEQIQRAMRYATEVTVLGQMMDTEGLGSFGVQAATEEKYKQIVSLKTSHYSFYLSLNMALALCDRLDALCPTHSLCMSMGYYFQAQDDYLDCFGDPNRTGKVGRDIEDAKITWLLVKALGEIGTNQEKLNILKENVGKEEPNCTLAVKNLYLELNMPAAFKKFQDNQNASLTKSIESFPIQALRPLLTLELQSLYNRSV